MHGNCFDEVSIAGMRLPSLQGRIHGALNEIIPVHARCLTRQKIYQRKSYPDKKPLKQSQCVHGNCFDEVSIAGMRLPSLQGRIHGALNEIIPVHARCLTWQKIYQRKSYPGKKLLKQSQCEHDVKHSNEAIPS